MRPKSASFSGEGVSKCDPKGTHLNNVFWGGGGRTITHGHAHPPKGIMYPAMGLEYAVSSSWIMQACNSGVVFSAHAICTGNRTQWNPSRLTCPISFPQITVSACNFRRGLRGVQGRLNALASRAGAFVHLPVLSCGAPLECIISSWSSPPKNVSIQAPATCRRRRSYARACRD